MRRLLILLALLFVLLQIFVSLPQPQAFTDAIKLTADDGMTADEFGVSVSISGDSTIVGAPYRDDASNVDQGAAYVFVRSGSTWTQQAKLTAADGSDFFGHSVSISADTVIIGAYLNTIGTNATQGAAYVFVRSGSTWTQQAKLVAADGAQGDVFGISVAVDGDFAVIGASQHNVGPNTDQGAAYVFVRSGSTWTQQAKLIAADGMATDVFGYSVSISGDTALIGAFGDDIEANTNQGAAYVFVRSGTSWVQQTKLTADDGMANDAFANALEISGDIAVIGPVNREAAYLFSRSGASWTQQPKLTRDDGQIGDNFGVIVAIDEGTVIVGAYLDDIGSNANQGAAYIFAPLGVKTATGFYYPVNVEITGDANWNACGASYDPGRRHIGADLFYDSAPHNNDTNIGKPVYAISKGTVFMKQGPYECSGWGINNYALAIRHSSTTGDFIAVYGHIRTNLNVPDPVSAGDQIGSLGPYEEHKNSAWNKDRSVCSDSGPLQTLKAHLHFGVFPSTDVFPLSGWGRIKEPCTDPDTNGFVNPLDWIRTKVPIN